MLFFTLLAVKVTISGIFLNTSPLRIASVNVAMADEAIADENQDLDKLEQQLVKREKAVLKKEAELIKMEQRLMPLKEEIAAGLEEYLELQSTLTAKVENLVKREKALKDSKITHLVRSYSSMEAGKAAILLDKMQMETVVRILGNMKGKSAGQILAMMKPDKGATISEKLSKSK